MSLVFKMAFVQFQGSLACPDCPVFDGPCIGPYSVCDLLDWNGECGSENEISDRAWVDNEELVIGIFHLAGGTHPRFGLWNAVTFAKDT